MSKRSNKTHPFTIWLRAQEDRDDPIGDLARDAGTDEGWPKGPGTIAIFRRHLVRKGASHPARNTLGVAWTEFLLSSL